MLDCGRISLNLGQGSKMKTILALSLFAPGCPLVRSGAPLKSRILPRRHLDDLLV